MAEDARLSTSLAEHPKIKKLGRRLGTAGQWHWVCLLLWVASNRSDGSLSGMSDEDIELAASWPADSPPFLPALRDLGLIDGKEFDSEIHDWAEHNPWMAGAKARSAKGRWNAVKRYHGEQEADRLVPEFRADRTATSNAAIKKIDATSNAPLPYPIPSPSPKPTAKEETPLQPAARKATGPIEIKTWLASLGEEKPIPAGHPVFSYADKTGIPVEFIELAWIRFVEDMSERRTRKTAWRIHYLNAVKNNWYKLWWFDQGTGKYKLTTTGEQAKRAA